MDAAQLPQGCRATSRTQFTFYHQVPRKSWYSFDRPWKNERLIDVGATSGLEHGTPGLGIQRLNH